ncbi:MAG: glycogen synthase GlgA [Gammaproteobacteria bacterium]|jgi:starch synthase
MPVNLKVLQAAAEVQPLIKTGGLADVTPALTEALRDLDLDARLLMPAYRGMAQKVGAKPVSRWFRPLLAADRVRLLMGHMPDSKVPIYLIDCPHLFDRPGNPYSDHYGRDFWDNCTRFGVLSKVASMFGGPQSPDGWRADVVHGHDWHCGLATAYLKFDPEATAAAVYTVHNLVFQGNFDRKVRKGLGIDSLAFHMEGLEFFGHLSFMKAGLFYADQITTVSPTYAREIQTPEYGCAMEGLLHMRDDQLSGILNGIDTRHWDPASDPLIPVHYDAGDLDIRAANKRALLGRFGLDAKNDAPLLSMLGRMTPQKGWRALRDAIPAMVDEGALILAVGSGNAEYEIQLKELEQRCPGRVAYHRGFSEEIAHQLMAGTDALLVPSTFEPCGLVQMYAQRYGAPPIARRTGGLADTIVDADASDSDAASGFLYDQPGPAGLLAAVRRALAVYGQDPERWRRLQMAGMARDFSWRRSASRYLEIYQNAIDARRVDKRAG